jgi:hypothetical protein
MPRLACWSCGRNIYATTPFESLLADERRCPRCGALMNPDRRDVQRREVLRRQNPPDDPGPTADGERRVAQRRSSKPRRGG